MDIFCRTVTKYITQGNAAIEKLAEEHSKGLAREEPLEPDTKRDGRGGNYIGGAFRNPLKSFSDDFLEKNARAIEEIWIIHQRHTGALNYGSLLNRLEGIGGKSYQEAVAEITDMEKRYNEWYARCREKPRDACINVFGRGMNFKWASMTMHLGRRAIKSLCVDGLNEYRKVRKENARGRG